MLYAIVAVIALILDQAVKYWTTAKIVLDTGLQKLIPGVIHMANVHNYGSAFSFLANASWARWLFVALCAVFTVAVIWMLWKNVIRGGLARWMAVLVLAGALGNCIDRILCGYVVDMFEFEFFAFPVFNVADIYITVGAIIFALCVLFEKEPEAETAKAASAKETETPVVVPIASAKQTKTRRTHQKVEVPHFEPHPQRETPAVDPNDPFAEWEHRAAEPEATFVEVKQPAAEPAAPAAKPAAPAAKPAAPAAKPAAPAAKPAAPAAKPAAPAAKPTAPAAKPAEPAAKPAAPAAKPAAPAAKPAEPTVSLDDVSFDLDDILAEFRDL